MKWIDGTLDKDGQTAIVEASGSIPANPAAMPAFESFDDPVTQELAKIGLDGVLRRGADHARVRHRVRWRHRDYRRSDGGLERLPGIVLAASGHEASETVGQSRLLLTSDHMMTLDSQSQSSSANRQARTPLWHPFADMSQVAASPGLTVERGEGIWVYDEEGRRYLDASGALWYCNVGHGRERIADAARDQMREGSRLPDLR